MSEVIASIIRRYLKNTEGFVRASAADETLRPGLALSSDEELVGWYRDPSRPASPVTAFTTSRFVIFDADRRTDVLFSEITDFEYPESKYRSEGVRVKAREGEAILVPISGNSGPDGRHLDALSLVMVLRSLKNVGKLAS